MKSRVVYYILLLLTEEEQVNIPGLGSLRRRSRPAVLNKGERKISPPSETAFLAAADAESDILAEFISFKTRMPLDDAIARVRQFSSALKEQLANTSSVKVEGLGDFIQRGDQVFFAADPDNLNAHYSGLRTVELPPLLQEEDKGESAPAATTGERTAATAASAKTDHEVREADESKQETEEEKRERRAMPLVIPLFVLLFLAASALAVFQYNSRQTAGVEERAFNRAPVAEAPIEQKEEEPFVVETTATSELDSEEYVYHRGMLSDEITAPAEDEPDTQSVFGDYEEQNETDVEDAGTGIVRGSLPDLTEDAQSENDVNEETSKEDCYVIVGAFEMSSNVERMVERLREMGYDVSKMPRGRLTQVGVPAECNTSEIEEILQNMRDSVESQAWIFKP